MEDKTHTTEITLLNSAYRFECAREEEEHLREAADYINEWVTQQVPESRDHLSRERLIAMVALNMADQLLESRRRCQKDAKTLSERIKSRLDQQHLQEQFEKPGYLCDSRQ